MFLRRLYYDKTTGAELLRSVIQGDAIAPMQETEAEDLTNWAVLEWAHPYEDIEAAFAEYDADGNRRTMTVTVQNGKPIFSYSPVVERQEDLNDMYAALALLGVTEGA